MNSHKDTPFRRLLVYSLVALPLLGLQPTFSQQAPSSERAQRLQKHVQYLASEELEGRGTATPGTEKAAEYLIKELTAAGAKAVPQGFRQTFQVVTGVERGSASALTAEVLVPRPGVPQDKWKKAPRPLAQSDFTPLGFSDNAEVSGGLVFAGYGITAKDAGYDDYEGIDVKGKVVVVLRGAPDQKINPSLPYEKNELDPHSKFTSFAALRYKAMNAREHGAAAILFITPQGDSADVLMPLNAERGGKNSGIPAFHVKRSTMTGIFPQQHSFYVAEQEIRKTLKPKSFAVPNTSFSVKADVKAIEKPTSNVLAMIPGTDASLASEYLVVGAHYDHLGWGGEGSLHSSKTPAIHPGADDNASGTAALIEVARSIAAAPLRRPVIFAAFSGEEIGLLGSQHYVENPAYPIASTVFMLNMDMVGRKKDGELNVQGTGTSPRWDALLTQVGKTFANEIKRTEDGQGPSDHASFYGKNVPVLFLFTGLHGDYHRPTDTWEKVSYNGMDTVVAIADNILRSVGNADTKPDFTKVASSSQAGRSTAFRVYVGTIPDYGDHPKGMRITGVSPGSPAEEAGLDAGDVIIGFAGKTIKNVYDYTYTLAELNAGQTIEVVILRGDDEKKLTKKLTLRAKK